MKEQQDYTIKLMVFLVVICTPLIFPRILRGQSGVNEIDYTSITAAGPRLGPIVIVEVTIPDQDALTLI